MDAGTEVLGEIKATIEANQAKQSELFNLLQTQKAEIKANGETTAQTAQRIADVEKSLKGHADDALAKMQAMEERMKDLQAKASRIPMHGGSAEAMKSLGEVFTKSAQYTDALKADRFHDTQVSFKQGQDVPWLMKDATLSGADGSGGPARDVLGTLRLLGIVAPALPMARMRDLIRVTPTTAGQIEYVEETDFNQIYTELSSTQAIGQTVLEVDNANGFFPGQTIVLQGGTPETRIIATGGVVTTEGANTITITVATAVEHLAGTAVTGDRYVYTAETKLKPTGRFVFDDVAVGVRTLATWTPVTRQLLADVARLRSHIDSRLVEALRFQEDVQVLYGDGSATQLTGIMTHARTQSYAWSSGIAGDTKLDAYRRAITLAQLAHYQVDGGLANPQDWEEIETVKGSDGHYLWMTAPGGAAQPRVWSVPIMVTTAITSGDGLVGAFRLGAELFDREEVTVRISEHHSDFFVRNKIAILAELREALAIYRPESFVAIDFDAEP